MKKIILLVLVLTVFIISCSEEWTVSDYSPVDKEESLSQLLDDTIVYTPEENPIDDYFDYYIGDVALLDGIESYVYYTSSQTKVCEVGVFKVKDKATADALLSAFDTKAENLAIVYENYSPEDTAIANNMQKGSFDDVVWFVATADNRPVIDIITK